MPEASRRSMRLRVNMLPLVMVETRMPRRLASSAMSKKRSWAIGSPCPCSSISSRQGSS